MSDSLEYLLMELGLSGLESEAYLAVGVYLVQLEQGDLVSARRVSVVR